MLAMLFLLIRFMILAVFWTARITAWLQWAMLRLIAALFTAARR